MQPVAELAGRLVELLADFADRLGGLPEHLTEALGAVRDRVARLLARAHGLVVTLV